MTKTLRRASGWVSEAKVPSEAAMRMRRSSSLKPARTWVMRGSKARAAWSARWMRSELGGDLGVGGGAGDGVEGGLVGGVAEAGDALLGRAAGDEGGGAGGAQQAVGGEVVGVGVAGALAGEDADAAADADALAGGLDQGLVDAERGGGNGLEVEVGVVAAGGERLAEAALHQALGEAELLDEISLVVGRWAGVLSACGRGTVPF